MRKNFVIDKSKLNFIVDALMFVFMMALAGIGFLMKFDLIPGKERWLQYGRNVDLFWLGLDRHEWGTIHLIIGYILLGLLLAHIVLHVKWIVTIYNRFLMSGKVKNIIIILFLAACTVLIVFSFFATPEVVDIGDRNHQNSQGYRGKMHRGES